MNFRRGIDVRAPWHAAWERQRESGRHSARWSRMTRRNSMVTPPATRSSRAAASPLPGAASPQRNTGEGAGGPGALGVEVHVKVLADAAAARAQFRKWVVPFPGSAGPTVTEVKN